MTIVFVSSLLVAMTWQFAQFVFLLQGFTLFGLQVMAIVSTSKVRMHIRYLSIYICMYCNCYVLSAIIHVCMFIVTSLLSQYLYMYITLTILHTYVHIINMVPTTSKLIKLLCVDKDVIYVHNTCMCINTVINKFCMQNHTKI